MEFRRVAPVVGLGALLVADAVLVTWALRPATTEVARAVSSSAAASATPDATGEEPSPSPSETDSPSPEPAGTEVAPLARLVSGVDDETAWVADAGSCSEPGRVLVTTDGGATWSSNAAPGLVLRVTATSATEGFVTGGDDGCAYRLWPTGDGGESWGDPQSGAGWWSRLPEEPGKVNSATGATVTPCPDGADVVDLVGLEVETALALCEGGEGRSTADAGASWTTTFTVEGALALGLTPDASAGVLVHTDDGCSGVVATAVRDGEPTEDGTCVESTPATGRVAVSGTASAWWLVSGDEAFVASSPDGPWEAVEGSLGES
jgi:hypothetical protein